MCFLSTNQSSTQAHKAETRRSSLIDLRSGSASCKLPKSPVLGAGQDILVAKAKRERETETERETERDRERQSESSLCTEDGQNVLDDVFGCTEVFSHEE